MRPTIHATCQNGYDGIISYSVDIGGVVKGPKKGRTATLIGLLVTNYRVRKGLPPIHPGQWGDKALLRNAERDNTVKGKRNV